MTRPENSPPNARIGESISSNHNLHQHRQLFHHIPLSVSHGFLDDCAEQPLSSLGRLYPHPRWNLIIHCAIGFKNPIDIDAIKSRLKTSLLLSHPRFSSLVVRDSHGVEHWPKETHIDLDRHIIILHNPVSTASQPVDHDTAVNDHLI
ncbi:hypothetical protein ACE6H2_027352 [Prunus campanulata]